MIVPLASRICTRTKQSLVVSTDRATVPARRFAVVAVANVVTRWVRSWRCRRPHPEMNSAVAPDGTAGHVSCTFRDVAGRTDTEPIGTTPSTMRSMLLTVPLASTSTHHAWPLASAAFTSTSDSDGAQMPVAYLLVRLLQDPISPSWSSVHPVHVT